MSKRLFAIILATAMLLSMLVTGGAMAENKYSAEGLGGYKIGFWYLPPTDNLSAGFRNALDYFAKITNCTMEYYDMTGWTSVDMNTAVESLVSNGCDGVICVIGGPSMFEYLNTNKVYYAGMTRSYTEEVAKVADNSEYCVGWIGDLGGETGVNFATGYNLAQVLADEGCKKIAVVGATEGETMNDERIMGIEAKAAETGMEIIARYRGADFNTGYADILSGYGTELDGIICTGGGDNGVAAIMAAGYAGRIKLVQVDEASEATKEYLEAGLLNATYAGGSTYIVSMYMQLFNALSGADRLFDEGSKIFPQFSGFIVTSAEEYDDASIYTTGEVPSGLLPDEILLMNSLAAPGLSIPEREQAIRDMMSIDYWNIVDIRERVSTYLSE